MTEWSFTLLLDHSPTDAEADALFAAGLDDALIAGDTLTVDRGATTLLSCIASAVSQIRSVGGLRPIGVRTDQPDAVTLADVSARLGGRRTTESLRLLAAGKRGPGGFPAPTVDTGRIRVYSWSQIATWLRDVLGEPVPEMGSDLALADQVLRLAEWAQATARADDVRLLLSA